MTTASTITLWIHPFNGIAGDMMLGALIDAGADVDRLRADLAKLGVDGWELHVDEVFRNGIGAANVSVAADEGHVHRNAADIVKIVDAAQLPARVTDRATRVFRALAEAEGHVHRSDPDAVHFHEVGGIDAIVDVVGACLALEQLGVDRVVVGPVANGIGMAKSAHGIIPNPAPATALLLEGVPVRGLDVPVELTTPTGAAIVAALADDFGPLPAMTVTGSGFGAGDTELEKHPNLLHVVLGSTIGEDGRELIVLETNVDDLSAEYVAHAVAALIDAGALDAWTTPIDMKKNRSAVLVSVLVEPVDIGRVGEVLLRETGSLGYRAHGVERVERRRDFGMVEVEGHEIRIKISDDTAKAEFDDVVRAAHALDRPARLIAAEAESLWRDDNPIR